MPANRWHLGTDLRIAAHASDGIVEAIEDPAHPFYLGVQWHPEDMTGESSASSIFAAFVAAARNRAVMRRPAGDLSRAGKVSSE
jgi:gamma-glutamyl-gamma-aminobutyrate hydrolase PuuD